MRTPGNLQIVFTRTHKFRQLNVDILCSHIHTRTQSRTQLLTPAHKSVNSRLPGSFRLFLQRKCWQRAASSEIGSELINSLVFSSPERETTPVGGKPGCVNSTQDTKTGRNAPSNEYASKHTQCSEHWNLGVLLNSTNSQYALLCSVFKINDWVVLFSKAVGTFKLTLLYLRHWSLLQAKLFLHFLPVFVAGVNEGQPIVAGVTLHGKTNKLCRSDSHKRR